MLYEFVRHFNTSTFGYGQRDARLGLEIARTDHQCCPINEATLKIGMSSIWSFNQRLSKYNLFSFNFINARTFIKWLVILTKKDRLGISHWHRSPYLHMERDRKEPRFILIQTKITIVLPQKRVLYRSSILISILVWVYGNCGNTGIGSCRQLRIYRGLRSQISIEFLTDASSANHCIAI